MSERHDMVDIVDQAHNAAKTMSTSTVPVLPKSKMIGGKIVSAAIIMFVWVYDVCFVVLELYIFFVILHDI